MDEIGVQLRASSEIYEFQVGCHVPRLCVGVRISLKTGPRKAVGRGTQSRKAGLGTYAESVAISQH